MDRIVVGVDGSDGSREALRWGTDLARRLGATVEVVHAWHDPFLGSGYPYTAAAFDPGESERAAHRQLDELVGAEDQTGLVAPIAQTIVNGSATAALIDSAKGAFLLVVGTRGQGGFTGILLGSVSQQVVHHAACPVVVIPPRK